MPSYMVKKFCMRYKVLKIITRNKLICHNLYLKIQNKKCPPPHYSLRHQHVIYFLCSGLLCKSCICTFKVYKKSINAQGLFLKEQQHLPKFCQFCKHFNQAGFTLYCDAFGQSVSDIYNMSRSFMTNPFFMNALDACSLS